MEGVLAIVAERGVTEVVGEAGGVDHVGIAAQRGADLTPDLRHLQRVREAGAREIVLAGRDNLCLRGQPAQRRGVQHAGAVALEGRPVRAGVFRWLGDQTRARFDVVRLHHRRAYRQSRTAQGRNTVAVAVSGRNVAVSGRNVAVSGRN
jgi:hypothetical protein